jgi:CheY-like chemotaxis protein
MKQPKTSILLVEDQLHVALVEKIVKERCGYSVHHVTKGETALKIVASQRTPVALVLMDIDLSRGIDGMTTATAILQLREIPIVFLSSPLKKVNSVL